MVGGIPNLGVEFPLNDWMTAEISASANPWKITDKLFYRHGRVQAEAKYWLRNLLARHYIGITGFYSMFDVGINRRAYYGDLSGSRCHVWIQLDSVTSLEP